MLIISITGILLIMGGVSFGFWKVEDSQEKGNTLKSRCLKFDIVEEKNDIKLENSYPITDEEAKKLTPYTFAIENQCEENINYTVKMEQLQKEREELLSSQYVAIEINEGQKEILGEYKEGKRTYEGNEYTSVEARELVKGTLKGKEKREYAIKIWIDEKVSEKDNAMNKSFISKIVVDGTMNEEYNEPILHGADPVLKEGLIPVTIDNKGTVRKAKLTEEWYSYERQEWANAVILTNNKTADSYQDNQVIPEDDIESYFVWIPKYKYKIFDMGHYDKLEDEIDAEAEQPIEIKYGITNTTNSETECIAPASGEDGECQEGKWMTHPAFTAFDTNGIWVGKFETGYKGATNQNESRKDTIEIDKIIIKPNEYSWRDITVGKMYQNSINYKTDLNSHMMKNTEWGAVAYLTNSIYGRCNKNTKICEEIMINNAGSYVTGVTAKQTPTTGLNVYTDWKNVTPRTENDYSYVYPKSIEASTTKNITGIYDMSGGSWEYVMGVTVDQNGKPIYKSSELTESDLKDERYYDAYRYNTNVYQFSNRILGDATGEMGPYKTYTSESTYFPIMSWYDDHAKFITQSTPWFARGALSSYGINAGIFASIGYDGTAHVIRSYRIVLAL